jgi:hypothetical protein
MNVWLTGDNRLTASSLRTNWALNAPEAEIAPHFTPGFNRTEGSALQSGGGPLGTFQSRADYSIRCDALTFGDSAPTLSSSKDGARNMARWLALVGMARDLAAADVNAVRSGIGTELRKLYSEVLREEIPDRMAALIKQLDQLMEARHRGRNTDDP